MDSCSPWFASWHVGHRFLAIAAALWMLGPAAGFAEPAPRQRQGEAYTFSMRIVGLFDAGRARLAIAPPYRNGTSTQVHIVGEAEATGLLKEITGIHNDYRLVLDGSTLLPRKMEVDESGIRNYSVVMQLDGRRFDLLARKKGAGERRLAGQLPSEPLEPVAVMLLLRSARLAEKDRLELILMEGANFYQGSIDVIGREDVTTALGTRKSIKLLCRGERINEHGAKLGRPPRQATMWVSDDAYRVPLRIEAQTDFGIGQFELESYEPARRPIPVPRHILGMTERKNNGPIAQ